MRVHHVALRVSDLEKCAAFYRETLGLAEVRRTERAVWLRAGDIVVMLETELRGEGPREGSGHLLAFAVDDLACWEKRLTEAEIAIDDRTPMTLYVRDPEGHRVGLSVFLLPD